MNAHVLAPGVQTARVHPTSDINECLASPGICGDDGTCSNTVPGYACACGGNSVLAEVDGTVMGGTCVGECMHGCGMQQQQAIAPGLLRGIRHHAGTS